jgi:hypothetical protein
MNVLRKDNIIDLFVWVDDNITKPVKPITGKNSLRGGRPVGLSSSEIITILIWDGITESHQTLRHVYNWIKREYADCFPSLPSYKTFVMAAHSNLGMMMQLLQFLLHYDSTLRFVDSTMLEVCTLDRMPFHKVARSIAAMGRNWQGWHYGLKLHLAIDVNCNLAGVCFTPANVYDAQCMEVLSLGLAKVMVGDTHYGASVMCKRLRKRGITVLSPPHPKQKTKLMSKVEQRLLRMRTKIEATFDYLKQHMHLVTSFPRSIKGLFVHYVRVLLGYQVGRVL